MHIPDGLIYWGGGRARVRFQNQMSWWLCAQGQHRCGLLTYTKTLVKQPAAPALTLGGLFVAWVDSDGFACTTSTAESVAGDWH